MREVEALDNKNVVYKQNLSLLLYDRARRSPTGIAAAGSLRRADIAETSALTPAAGPCVWT